VWSVLRLNYGSCWGNSFDELELLIFEKKLNSTEGTELLKSCVQMSLDEHIIPWKWSFFFFLLAALKEKKSMLYWADNRRISL